VLTIRRATVDDATRLAALRFAFRAAQNPAVEPEGEFLARCTPWMRERLAEYTPWRCWVAESGGDLVGHLWLQLIEKIPNPAPELEQHGYITNVFVLPEARGSGAGSRLLETALEYCRQHRVDSVILWPTERSRPLYQRHGFVEPGDILELVLDEHRDLH
jgi:GNAT superfamily N-acetyltransferase